MAVRDPVLSSLDVEVTTASRAVLDTRWNVSNYSDNNSRLYYIESGEAYVRHHGREYHLRPGYLFVIPAHTILSYRCPERFVQLWVHFSATLFGGLPLLDYLQCEFEVRVDNPRHVVALFKRLRRVFASDSPERGLETRGLLLQLLAPFARTADRALQEKRRQGILRFRNVLEYVNRHLGEPITVDDLAGLAHLERTYFTRLFAAHFGVPPARYVLLRRVERAKRLLWETGDTLESIAADLGFADGFHLSKAFKRVTGIPPSEFRRQPRGVS
jgi:AraC-like DNA-binding protein